MFTGIIQRLLPIAAIKRLSPHDAQLFIELDPDFTKGLTLGASVAIDGVCLTVASLDEAGLCGFDVMGETLQRSTLQMMQIGQAVNLERALKFGDEVGGHLMSGHVFERARILAIKAHGLHTVMECQASVRAGQFLFEKGYVGLDGTSLTLGAVKGCASHVSFFVHLIPETIARTTLGRKLVGDEVNLEIDTQTQAIVETCLRFLATRNPSQNQ